MAEWACYAADKPDGCERNNRILEKQDENSVVVVDDDNYDENNEDDKMRKLSVFLEHVSIIMYLVRGQFEQLCRKFVLLSPSLKHCLRKPPVLMFRLVSTPLKARELVNTITSTRDISRFRNEKLVSRLIPPQGSITS